MAISQFLQIMFATSYNIAKNFSQAGQKIFAATPALHSNFCPYACSKDHHWQNLWDKNIAGGEQNIILHQKISPAKLGGHINAFAAKFQCIL